MVVVVWVFCVICWFVSVLEVLIEVLLCSYLSFVFVGFLEWCLFVVLLCVGLFVL